MLSNCKIKFILTYFSYDPYVSGSDGTRRLLGYERVYLPLNKVANTHFHIQGNGEKAAKKTSCLECQTTKLP